MLMLINNLGRDYIVWDKAAQIEFLKPGKTALFAEFAIDQELIDQVQKQTDLNRKYIFDLPVDIKDTDGQIVAKVIKQLYVRKK